MLSLMHLAPRCSANPLSSLSVRQHLSTRLSLDLPTSFACRTLAAPSCHAVGIVDLYDAGALLDLRPYVIGNPGLR